jgi:hypothetical protein
MNSIYFGLLGHPQEYIKAKSKYTLPIYRIREGRVREGGSRGILCIEQSILILILEQGLIKPLCV